MDVHHQSYLGYYVVPPRVRRNGPFEFICIQAPPLVSLVQIISPRTELQCSCQFLRSFHGCRSTAYPGSRNVGSSTWGSRSQRIEPLPENHARLQTACCRRIINIGSLIIGTIMQGMKLRTYATDRMEKYSNASISGLYFIELMRIYTVSACGYCSIKSSMYFRSWTSGIKTLIIIWLPNPRTR
jgi:hypothetical protein